MSKKVTIPTDGGNPFVVILGGIKYVYKPGETVDVPDGVALEIKEWERWKNKYHGAVQPPFAAGGGGVQPDLSQNDPNAADYVKNRTHYVQSEQKEIIPPTSVQSSTSVGWTALGDGVKLWASYFRRGGLANPQRGERYKAIVGLNELIEFNPVSAHESDEFVNGTYAGNLFLYGVYKINSKTATKAEIEAMGYVDNGESFFFGTAVDFPNPYIITTSQLYPNLTSLTRVSVEQCEVIKKLDKKYLPDDVGGSNKVIVEKTFTIPAQSKMTRSAQSQGTKLSFHYLHLNESDLSCQYRLIDGETYTFKAPDGNVYSVLASRRRSDAAVGFFVATDTFNCEFEDTGSYTLPIVSIGDGLTVPTNTGQRNAFEYGISGKFEVARCLSRDTVDFSIGSQALDQWNCINGVLVGLAALIGFVCCNDQWNATISKISYASGSLFDARMAYPLALLRSEDKGNIADAELDFMIWNTYSNQWHFLRADVLNGTVSDLPQFPS